MSVLNARESRACWHLRWTSAALVLGLLTGCALIGGKPVTYTTYDLRPDRESPSDSPVDWQLLIATPVAAGPLADARIAVRGIDGGYGVLRGARWSEPANALLATTLVRAFEDSGRVRAVARVGSGVRGDRLLLSELRAFESVRSPTGSRASISVALKLVRMDSGEVIASRTFSAQGEDSAEDIGSIVRGFEQAVAAIAGEILEWTLSSQPGASAPQ